MLHNWSKVLKGRNMSAFDTPWLYDVTIKCTAEKGQKEKRAISTFKHISYEEVWDPDGSRCWGCDETMSKDAAQTDCAKFKFYLSFQP